MFDVKVKFINGNSGVYTSNVIEMFKNDMEVIQIMDNTTGEVIYINELYVNAMNMYFEAFKKQLKKGV